MNLIWLVLVDKLEIAAEKFDINGDVHYENLLDLSLFTEKLWSILVLFVESLPNQTMNLATGLLKQSHTIKCF